MATTKQGRALLTPRTLEAMKPGEWRADPAPRGEGVLQVRKLRDGSACFYFRYTHDGETVRLPIGSGLTLAEARAKRRELSLRYQSGDRDLRAVLDAEQREDARQRAEAEAAAAAEAATRRATLGALLTGYVEQLRRDARPSARLVDGALRRHVERAWPDLWVSPATEVRPEDVLAVVGRVVQRGNLREAAKLRSYVRAAYAAAIRARLDPRGMAALRELRITTNPARDVPAVEGAAAVRERALSAAELRAYWRRIAKMPGPGGALLRFHLLTGGQRIEQLARLTLADFDADTQTVRLRDPKGRRKVARPHDVPLIPEAVAAMTGMRGGELGLNLFTVTFGETGAGYATVRAQLLPVVVAMIEAGELEGAPFTPGDLRRTVETRLASLGVPREVRAQLQSHGLGGVQARHYDRHDYLAEKRDALQRLFELVTGTAASVTQIRTKSGASR